MATDSNFTGIGGGNVDVGIVGWAIPGGPALHPLDIGVFGLGAQRGVFGMIDDGTLTPGLGLPTAASFLTSSGVFGAAPAATGVGGVSGTGVGVFGQAGPFAKTFTQFLALGGSSCGVLGTADTHPGVSGFSDTSQGVTGTSTGNDGVSGLSVTGVGVSGQSQTNNGVVGLAAGSAEVIPLVDPQPHKLDARTNAGVYGAGKAQIGVGGTSVTSIGVLGQTGAKAPVFDKKTTYTAGVVGTSKDTTGVIGFSENHIGILGVLGAAPPSPADLPPNFVAGVIGSSDQGVGVIGMSNQLVGVRGISNTSYGILGETSNPASYAGYFKGNVMVTGALTIAGDLALLDATVVAKVKNAVVPFPDGTRRLLHCMESPEHWFEDFGAAKLKKGRAVVKLDADFAKVIKRGDYHVFLTPRGDCRGLYVRRQGGRAFEVREFQGGKSSVAFSYRVVGKRKDITAHRRFAKVEVKPPMLSAPRTRRTRSSIDALLAKVRKQAGAKPARARRRKMARPPQRLPALLAKLRKQAGAKPTRGRKRAKKRA